MNPTVIYGPLGDVLPDRRHQIDERAPGDEPIGKIEAREAIADEIGEEVQRRVEEREQPEHPAEANHRIPAAEPANGRDGEGNDDEAERPDAGLVGDLDERIGGEVAVDSRATPDAQPE